MSQDKEAGSPRLGVLKIALWGAALVGVAVVVYIIAQAFITPRSKGGLKDLTRGEMSRLILPAEASAAPATSFLDSDGKPVRIGDFRGKVVLLNFWASWCGVCKTEKPSIYKMADAMHRDDFVVIGLASDHSWSDVLIALVESLAPPSRSRAGAARQLPAGPVVSLAPPS